MCFRKIVLCQWFGLEGTLTVEHLSLTVNPSICHSAVAASQSLCCLWLRDIFGNQLCEKKSLWNVDMLEAGESLKVTGRKSGMSDGEYWRMKTYRSVGFA